MTLEELWELFPIILKGYNPEYPKWYEVEKEKLVEGFSEAGMVRISHIGSTAVPNIISKPTIDILMEIQEGSPIGALKEKLESIPSPCALCG